MVQALGPIAESFLVFVGHHLLYSRVAFAIYLEARSAIEPDAGQRSWCCLRTPRAGELDKLDHPYARTLDFSSLA